MDIDIVLTELRLGLSATSRKRKLRIYSSGLYRHVSEECDVVLFGNSSGTVRRASSARRGRANDIFDRLARYAPVNKYERCRRWVKVRERVSAATGKFQSVTQQRRRRFDSNGYVRGMFADGLPILAR